MQQVLVLILCTHISSYMLVYEGVALVLVMGCMLFNHELQYSTDVNFHVEAAKNSKLLEEALRNDGYDFPPSTDCCLESVINMLKDKSHKLRELDKESRQELADYYKQKVGLCR